MVQMNTELSTLQKCNLVQNVYTKALTTVCGLDQKKQFSKILETALIRNTLNSDQGIKAFINTFAPHVKKQPFVTYLFKETNKMFQLSKNLEMIQYHRDLQSINSLISQNKLSPDVLSSVETIMAQPDSYFSKKVSEVEQWFQTPENMKELDYNVLIAQLTEDFLNKLTQDDTNEKKEKKYQEMYDTETLTSASVFEDYSASFDWERFLREVIYVALDKIANEKMMADIGFSFGLTLATKLPFDLLKNIITQMDEIKKSRLKKTAENRNKHIDTTLKNHGLNRDKLAILLAQEARDWILDDRIFCKLDRKKIKFAAKLKKDASGNLIYKEFSKKEKKIYFKYLSKYANSKEWKRRSNYLSGTILTPDERETLLLNASKKHVVGQLYSTQHFSETDIINKIDAITKEVSKPESINKSSATPHPITTWRPYRPLPSVSVPHTRAG